MTATDGTVLTYQVVINRAAPPILVTTDAITLLGNGSYQAIVTVTNTGGVAQNVTLVSSSLGSASGTPATVPLGTVPSGGNASTTVVFPSSAGAPGAATVIRITGTYTGGTFGGSARTTLP